MHGVQRSYAYKLTGALHYQCGGSFYTKASLLLLGQHESKLTLCNYYQHISCASRLSDAHGDKLSSICY
jgi:hypothetical protein